MRKAIPFLLALGLAAPAWATTYYVSWDTGTDPGTCTGNDNGCGSIGTPCKTLNCALAEINLNAGDRLEIAPRTSGGDYYCAATADSAVMNMTDANDAGTNGNPVIVIGSGGTTKTKIYGVDCTALDDSLWTQCSAAEDCDENGNTTDESSTYVYKQDIGSRSVSRVYDLNQENFTVQCAPPDNTLVGYQTTAPFAMTNCSGGGPPLDLDVPGTPAYASAWACLKALSGSYYKSGTKLYFHSWDDDTNQATIRANRNVETSHVDYIINAAVADVTFDNFDTRFAGANIMLRISGSDRITFQNGVASSAHTNIFAIQSTADSATISNYTVSNNAERRAINLGEDSAPCPTPTTQNCGWCQSSGSSWLIAAGGSGTSQTGHVLRDVTAFNGGNGVSFDQVSSAVIDRVMVKNTPNHSLYLQASGGACSDILVRRSGAWNAQDGITLASNCTNVKIVNSYSQGFGIELGSSVTFRANLSGAGIRFNGSGTGVGSTSNRNWLDNNNSSKKCKNQDTSSSTVQCAINWGASYDANGVFGTTGDTNVKLTGFATWPPSTDQGTGPSLWTWADFAPLTGSSLVNVGGLDFDGDGDDDPCTSTEGCVGSALDIGPIEFGGEPQAIHGLRIVGGAVR